MRAMKRLALLSIVVLTPAIASAQAETDSNLFWDVTKAVVFDPTTYAPATLSYTSMKMDWESSQPLFRNGWVEQNRYFTRSGRANDLPVETRLPRERAQQYVVRHCCHPLEFPPAASNAARTLVRRTWLNAVHR